MSRYRVHTWARRRCKDCGVATLWRCMDCRGPVCAACEFSMHALCQDCRAAYTGPLWQLGARADRYIRGELERLMPAL